MGTTTLSPVAHVVKERIETVKMSIKFYDSDLETEFREYVAQNDSSNNALMNKLVEVVFELEPVFSQDKLKNLEEMADLLSMIDWQTLNGIKDQLQASPLTRNVTLKDVVTGMILEGVNSHKNGNAK
ncbi:MAG: hypothetical protein AAF703_22175 [Cyanobacteria bacterium P01_D01_bin.105]